MKVTVKSIYGGAPLLSQGTLIGPDSESGFCPNLVFAHAPFHHCETLEKLGCLGVTADAALTDGKTDGKPGYS